MGSPWVIEIGAEDRLIEQRREWAFGIPGG